MTPPPPKRGRPPRPPDPPPPTPDDNLAGRCRAIIEQGVVTMESEMLALTSSVISEGALDRIIVLTEKAATTMNHIRRADDSLVTRSKKITDSMGVAWLDAMNPDARAQLLERYGVREGEERKASVLA